MTLSNPMARLKYNAQLEQALQDAEDDYTGKQADVFTSILQISAVYCGLDLFSGLCRSASEQMAGWS